ncbi:MAG: cysteine hydrolase family protein [Prolixibacteraceae bacterium]
MKALLIIDMQKISFTPETPRYDSDGVIRRINKLAEVFRKKDDVIILIQHDGSTENFCSPGTEEWEILSELVNHKNDCIVPKTVNDAFYHSELKEILQRLDIEELVITGCATDFCVDSTVKSALINDYKVTVISDGHTTADRTKISAQLLIEHYNWIWSEMTPAKHAIKVISFDDYIKLNPQ